MCPWETKQKPLLTKRNIRDHLTFAQNTLMTPQAFCNNVLIELNVVKVDLFGRRGPVKSDVKVTAFHNQNIIPAVKHGGGSREDEIFFRATIFRL